MKSGFDMSKVQRGARLRRTPFFESTQKYGARGYTVYNHMFFPIQFNDLEEEYNSLLNDVTLWDVSVERQVEIKGPDAFAFTNLLTPRDLSKCKVGQAKYVLITAEDGGIVNDPVLLRLGENHFWLALADSDVLLWAKGVAYKLGMDVEITELDVHPLQIQGPKSKEVVSSLFGNKILELKYYYFLETELDGIPVVVTRTGWSGELGFEIYLRDGSRGTDLWERVMDAGKAHNIVPTGPSDIRRIEAGILNYGADITLENNPYELDLDWMVDLDQEADFIGKEALKRIKAEGVKQKLLGIQIEGEAIKLNMTKWPVRVANTKVGVVTSAIHSPRFGNIAYAWLPTEQFELGTILTVHHPEMGDLQAKVVQKPFVDPKKDIPKS